MIKKIFLLSFVSLIFSNNDKILSLMNNDSNWQLLSQNEGIAIYQNDNENFPIIKIERELTLDYSMHEIFNIIKNAVLWLSVTAN